MLTVNELGEFGVPEPFDPEARRASVYASLRATEVRKLGRHEPADYVRCGICGRPFVPSRKGKKYCSEDCRAEAKRRSWRKHWMERKKNGRSR